MNEHGITSVKISTSRAHPALRINFVSLERLLEFKKRVNAGQYTAKRAFAYYVIGRGAKTASELIGFDLGWREKNHLRLTVSDEELVEGAKKYQSRTEWWKGALRQYVEVTRNRRHLLDRCTAHMDPPAGGHHRAHQVYEYIFDDGTVYLGLTCRPRRRHDAHQEMGPVFQKIKSGVGWRLDILAEKLLAMEAKKMEIDLIAQRKASGITVLNKTRGGELAGLASRFTFEQCLAASRECKSRFDFHEKREAEYYASKKYGWYEEIVRVNGWPKRIKSGSKWSLEICSNIAKSYGSVPAWSTGNKPSYAMAGKRGWLPTIKKLIGAPERKIRSDRRRPLA
jgi:predicted GIY-YIG superfamily endonuclease